MFSSMASTSATQPITTISNATILTTTTTTSCDEKNDIDFMSQFEIKLGTQEASDVALDVIQEISFPKLRAY